MRRHCEQRHAVPAPHAGQGGFQNIQILSGRPDAGSAVGQPVQSVIGTGVAVHGSPVKGHFRSAPEHGLPLRGFNCRVAQHHGKHGCHIRADHARAFGHTRQNDASAAEFEHLARVFRESIRGHDGCGKIFDRGSAKVGGNFRRGLFP